MSLRATVNRPSKWSPEDAKRHREIDLEHAISREYLIEHGRPPSLYQFPAIRRLLESCDEAARRGYKFSNKRFRYCDRTFPVELTSLGRVIVLHPETGKRLGATSWFAAW